MTAPGLLDHSLVARPRDHRIAGDLFALAALLAVALLTGSFCLLAQFVRHAGIAVGHAIAAMALRHASDRARSHYQFGYEKLGRCCALLLALALVASGLWLFVDGPALAVELGRQPPPLLAFVATANLLWLLWSWADERGRTAARGLGVSAQLLLTLAALLPDSHLAAAGDALAGLLIAGLSLVHGIHIAVDAVRDLIDAPARAAALERTLALLFAAGLDRRALRSFRSRQVGRKLFLELDLDLPEGETVAATRARLERAVTAVAGGSLGLDLSLRLHRA